MFSVLSIRRIAVALAGCAALLTPALANAGSKVPPSTNLTLINGWTNGAFGAANASVSTVGGIVRFQGAIATTGTNPEPFVLPAAFRPESIVYVKIDLCNAHNGRLEIDPSGDTFVQAEGDFSCAQEFTSLDGASFALAPDTFKQLKLKHHWKAYGFGTADPAVAAPLVVHLAGAMKTKRTDTNAFKLSRKFRPASQVYVPVDMCNATNGRLVIDPTGIVNVEAETDFGNAQCFTSLDGVSFARTSNGFTALSLINGWEQYGTRNAAVRTSGGVVHFEGAITTSGTNGTPFVLPSAFRPSHPVWIPVDLCNATNGRLDIATNGTVTVEAETNFANAQCFTSLEGATFHL